MSNKKTIVQLAVEALDTGDVSKTYFHPSKQQLATSPQEISEILPTSDKANSSFIEVLTSESYVLCVKKLASYMNISVEDLTREHPNLYTFNALVMEIMQGLMMVEGQNKQRLEKLAVDVVLNLPEFTMFKREFEKGTLKIDAKLGMGELEGAMTQEDLEEMMNENQEEVIEDIALEIAQDPEKKLKRAFHNYIVQGNALHKSFLFNMVNEQLNEIDDTLSSQYGLFMAIVHVLYYGHPYVEGPQLKMAGVGSAEVDSDGTIKARGIVFPVLVHEIVKALYDFLGADVSPETHGSETLEDEYMQLMASPGLFNKLNRMIPANKIELMPIIYRLLLQRPSEDIKQVIANSPQGKQIIDQLAIEAQAMADETDEEPDYNEFDAGADFGEPDTGDEDEDDDPYGLYQGF